MSLRPDLTQSDYELLSAYIDNMLADDERALLEERLNREPDLRDELMALQQTVKLIAQLPALKATRDFVLTPDMVAIKPKLTVVPRPSLSQRSRIPLSLTTVMSTAASMMLVIVGIVLLFSGENGDATSYVASAPDTEVGLYSSASPESLMTLSSPSVGLGTMPTAFATISAAPAGVASTAWPIEGGTSRSQDGFQDQSEQGAIADSVQAQIRDDANEPADVGAVSADEQDIAGGGEAPLFAQAPAPAVSGEEEAPNAVELDSDDAAYGVIALPTSSPFVVIAPPVPTAPTVGTISAESQVGQDRERSAAEDQIPPASTDLMLEPSLALVQPTFEATPATAVAEAAEGSTVNEAGDGDDGIVSPLAEPALQIESSDGSQNRVFVGVLLIVTGCTMFVSLLVFVWLQRRRG